MKEILIALLTGIIFGIIDVLPMVKMKMDKYAILSAFMHYLIAPFIIFNIAIKGMTWWLQGGIINLALAVPVIILAAKDDKKSILPMTGTSIILGTLIAAIGHFVL